MRRMGAAGTQTRSCLEHHLLHPQILTVQLHIRKTTILLGWHCSKLNCQKSVCKSIMTKKGMPLLPKGFQGKTSLKIFSL